MVNRGVLLIASCWKSIKGKVKHSDCEARLRFKLRFFVLCPCTSYLNCKLGGGGVIIILVSLGRLSENLFAVNTEPFLAVIFVLALYC